MRLIDFHASEPIFIDANIFTYFALQNPTFQTSCTSFVERIEREEIQAITSTFVLNEVYYALLIGKGSELLNSTSIKRIKKSLTSDSSIAAQCYDACQGFDQYLYVLHAKGLQIVELSYQTLRASLSCGREYQLLPTDALHVATCQQHGITHVATADADFDKIDGLRIWKP